MRRARRGPHRSQAAGRAPPVLLEVARGRAELRAAVLGTRGPGCALRREGLGRWLGGAHKTLLWWLQEVMGKQAKQLSLGLGNLSDLSRR